MFIPSIRVRVSGDLACFTWPEAKVERFSYPVMTPSVARNILDSICWQPQMRWIVTSITVLKPIRMISALRIEVQSKLSPVAIKKWMQDASKYEPLIVGVGSGTDSTPRNTVLLRNVAYWIDAYPHIFETFGDNTPVKYVEMLRRRVKKGQCFQRPYLGCREFAAQFGFPRKDDHPIDESMEIGRMLYDIAYLANGNSAVFFDAHMKNGVIETRPELVLAGQRWHQEVLNCSYRH